MKNITIGDYEKRDIEQQVAKVLKGLGNPEPPLKIADALDLLKLDLHYYRSGEDDSVKEFISKIRIGLKQLVMRPTLIWDVIKKANLSALWLPDQKRILIDANAPQLKHRWYSGHEITHGILPWHSQFLLGDTTKELNPLCAEIIEAEANHGAGQLLFLQKRFTEQAKNMALCLTSIKSLSKHFGNSITSTLWRYVEEVCDECPVVALVTSHPHYLKESKDSLEPCRRCIESPLFKEQFGHISELELFGKLFGYCRRSKKGPVGESEVVLTDRNGENHWFHFESFSNGYDVLTLAVYRRKCAMVVGF